MTQNIDIGFPNIFSKYRTQIDVEDLARNAQSDWQSRLGFNACHVSTKNDSCITAKSITRLHDEATLLPQERHHGVAPLRWKP